MTVLTSEDWELLDKMGDRSNPYEIARVVGRRLFARIEAISRVQRLPGPLNLQARTMMEGDYQKLKKEWEVRP